MQVGITSIGILSGAIGEAAIADRVRLALEPIPLLAPYAALLSIAIMVVPLTYVSLVVGELVPKRLGLTRPEYIASLVSGPMHTLAAIGRPVVYVLSQSTNMLLRVLRVSQTKPSAVSLEEIKVLMQQGTDEGVFEKTEQELVTNVLHLDERQVGAVLTPRPDVVFLDVQLSFEHNRVTLTDRPTPFCRCAAAASMTSSVSSGRPMFSPVSCAVNRWISRHLHRGRCSCRGP